VAVELRPALVRVELVVEGQEAVRVGSAIGTDGPMNAAADTRSEWSAASISPRWPPIEKPTIAACSTSFASSTASASATNSASAYAAASSGRSDLPLPRPSNVSTRQCRARYGICIFQSREWTIDQVGSSRTVGSPAPNTS
jgi:hypothetical protein